MRKFNVYSPLVVLYPNETFEWLVNAAEAPSVTVEPVTTWPLTAGQYNVTAGTPSQAIAGSQSNIEAQFTCTPPPKNVTTQTIVVAAREMIHVCNDVNVLPGEYFIWKNDTANSVNIAPDGANTDFWPLPGQDHDVPANGWLALQVPATAETDKSYLLVLTFEGGGACAQNTQPKLIVGGSGL